MFELFMLLLLFVIGWFAGQIYAIWHVRDVIIELSRKDAASEGTTKIKLNIFKVEQIKDTLYLYDAESDKFICQGPTLDLLAHRVKEIKYNTIPEAPAAVIYNNDKIWFVNGKVFKSIAEVLANEN